MIQINLQTQNVLNMREFIKIDQIVAYFGNTFFSQLLMVFIFIYNCKDVGKVASSTDLVILMRCSSAASMICCLALAIAFAFFLCSFLFELCLVGFFDLLQ